MATKFPRLRDVFGSDPESATAETIERLVAERVRETSDLDFKRQLYDRNNAGSSSLADDVAAIANFGGGIIVLGIREDNTAAVESVPVPLSDEEERRMQSLIADNIFPKPGVFIHPIRKKPEDTEGWYFILIESPANPPCAVWSNQKYLRYPTRNQHQNRFLGENEVAQAYRQRFEVAERRENRHERNIAEGRKCWRHSEGHPWLEVALTPVKPGAFTINARSVNQAQMTFWARAAQNQSWFNSSSPVGVSTAFRKIRLQPSEASRRNFVGEHHVDGSTYFSSRLRVYAPDQGGKSRSIRRRDLMWVVGELFRIALDHAVSISSCHGDALLTVALLPAEGAEPLKLRPPDNVPYYSDEPGILSSPVESARTIDLEASASDPAEFLHIVRASLTDFYQSMGEPEVDLINENNEVNTQLLDERTVHAMRTCFLPEMK